MHGLWNQTPGEGLDSLILQSYPGGEVSGGCGDTDRVTFLWLQAVKVLVYTKQQLGLPSALEWVPLGASIVLLGNVSAHVAL